MIAEKELEEFERLITNLPKKAFAFESSAYVANMGGVIGYEAHDYLQKINPIFMMAPKLLDEVKTLREAVDVMAEALEDCMLPPYDDSDLQSLIFTLNDRARFALNNEAVKKVLK